MKTRTFRHKNSKTRKSKKGGQSLEAVKFAAKNPGTVAAMAKTLSVAKGIGSKANKVGANLGKELNKVKNSDQAQKAIEGMTNMKNTGMKKFNEVKNSDQAQKAIEGMTNIKNKGMDRFNQVMNSEQAQKTKEKLKKKGNEFGNMASTFMNSMKNMKKGGRKWSIKYKRSINCKRPKGFSQKQHCKYGRRKSRRTRKSRK